MLTLNNIVSISKKRKRVGRGGSRGGTSGKGHKGQKARTSGTVGPMFEGGQMPIHRRLPKRGFSNHRFADVFEIVNVGTLEDKFDQGSEVTYAALVEKGIISGKKGVLVKILGNGALTKKLTVHADACSKSALEVIQKNGGEVRMGQLN